MTTEPGQYSDVEYVFEPHSPALPDLREYAAALWDRRQFMMELARADLRSLRTSTALGNIWSVLDPLFQAGIYYFLFAVLRKGSSNQVAFLPVLLGGFFLFGLSMAALNEGGGSIKRAKGLLLGVDVPARAAPDHDGVQVAEELHPVDLRLRGAVPARRRQVRDRSVPPPAAVRDPDTS